MKSVQTVAIVGNPNCGKTTLFNRLTGSQQKVGNWAGVTVERKQGEMRIDGRALTLVDLPGVYSLSVASEAHAIDEYIACEYIHSGEADLIINILDGSNLKRNLYLTLQLLEMGVPCILAVNMLDIAKQRGVDLDLRALERLLGCPVVPMVSTQNKGIDELKQTIAKCDPKHIPHQPALAQFDEVIETSVVALQRNIQGYNEAYTPAMARAMAIRLLEQDLFASKVIVDETIQEQAHNFQANIESTLAEEADILIADARYQQISQIVRSIQQHESTKRHGLSYWLDSVVLNRFLGIPIFLAIMYLMFEFSMDLGSVLSPIFDQGSTTVFVDGLQYLGAVWHLPTWLIAILANGVGLGVNTVLTFIPQIGLMFLCLSFLEDSGYMARAAFVMDKFMQSVGLPGKSFIPLIVAFGCNVPSVMATRTLENPRDRLLTILMTPFMSCGARLAIFVVFGTAFFPEHAGLMVFLLYLTGIAVAMVTGFIFKLTILKGKSAPFILELPNYHLPDVKTISRLTWQRLKGFVVRAGKYIIPICVLLGTLNAIQLDGKVVPNGSPESLLAYSGRAITPILQPMGVSQDNWPATVGLVTGLLAKEVVVGTLNTLYTQQQTDAGFDPAAYSLSDGLHAAWQDTVDGLASIFSATMLNPFTANEADHDMTRSAMGNMQTAFSSAAAAFAYLLFVLLYIPCVSTIATIAREIGTRWAYFSSAWSLSVAYSAAVIFYQLSIFFQQPVVASSWVIGLIAANVFWIYGLLRWGNLRSVSPSGMLTSKPAPDCHW
tara:strand:- start:3738 stop:6068 length:2331 start_codon:yes stop_codon:yes gene_type:complete